jgi:hypothetical protein
MPNHPINKPKQPGAPPTGRFERNFALQTTFNGLIIARSVVCSTAFYYSGIVKLCLEIISDYF